mgnify:FL=1
MVFVPDLEGSTGGSGGFLSYDGFLLVSSSWLHDDSSIFIEMPAHLLLLR